MEANVLLLWFMAAVTGMVLGEML